MRRFGLARQPPRPRQRLHATRLLSVLLCLPCLAASSFAGTARSGAAVSDSATWSIVAGATASLDTTFYLSDDTCVGPTDCIAVGSSATAGEDSVQPLIESWDGTEWSSTIPPLISGSGGGLTAVSCADADHCLAVGNGDGGQLIESWDGITWSAVSPPATAGHLTGVSCPAPDHCVAVGWGVYQFYGITLMETWDGTTWSVAEGPAKSANNYFLNGISCTDDGNDCMAVGDYDPGVGGGIVTESWDGTDWSFATLAGPVSEGILNGVSCPDPSDCVAVGTHVVGRSTLTLVESWNGTSWSTIPSPNPTYGPKRLYSYSQLSAVSCSNTLSCSAVGDAVAKKGTQKKPASGGTLVETWDGSNWSIVPSPTTPQSGGSLTGVSCLEAPGYCLASAGSALTSGPSTFEDDIPLTITTTSLPEGTIGVQYSATLGADSGNQPYKWVLAAGSMKLPNGLKLNGSTGTISGTPGRTAASSTVTVEVADADVGSQKAHNTAIGTFAIMIGP